MSGEVWYPGQARLDRDGFAVRETVYWMARRIFDFEARASWVEGPHEKRAGKR